MRRWRGFAVGLIGLAILAALAIRRNSDSADQIVSRYGRLDGTYEIGAMLPHMWALLPATPEGTKRSVMFEVTPDHEQISFVINDVHWPPGGPDALVAELVKDGWRNDLTDRRTLLRPPHSLIHITEDASKIIYTRPANAAEHTMHILKTTLHLKD